MLITAGRLFWGGCLVGLAAIGPWEAAAIAKSAAAPMPPIPPSAWQLYTDQADRFTIEFPRDWSVARNPFRILVATSPRENRTDRYQENIKIVATDVAPGLSLEAYYRNSLEVYRSVWKVRQVTAGRLAGGPVKRVMLDQSLGPIKTRVLKCFLLQQGQIFVITGAAEPKNYEQFVPIFEAALTTLRIAPRTPAPQLSIPPRPSESP